VQLGARQKGLWLRGAWPLKVSCNLAVRRMCAISLPSCQADTHCEKTETVTQWREHPAFRRFQPVSGLAAFDLDTFLAMAQRSRKWQCPTSGFNGTVHDVQVDAFMDRILAQLKVRRQGLGSGSGSELGKTRSWSLHWSSAC